MRDRNQSAGGEGRREETGTSLRVEKGGEKRPAPVCGWRREERRDRHQSAGEEGRRRAMKKWLFVTLALMVWTAAAAQGAMGVPVATEVEKVKVELLSPEEGAFVQQNDASTGCSAH